MLLNILFLLLILASSTLANAKENCKVFFLSNEISAQWQACDDELRPDYQEKCYRDLLKSFKAKHDEKYQCYDEIIKEIDYQSWKAQQDRRMLREFEKEEDFESDF